MSKYLIILLIVFTLGYSENIPTPTVYIKIAEKTQPAIQETNNLFVDAEPQSRLSAYRPIYYLEGIKSNNEIATTKVNISFKYQIVEDLNLFFGYSQRLFWDREKSSKPFRDINHNPEVFYTWKFNNSLIKSIDLGLHEHLSNGLAGEASRSIDGRYLRFNTSYKYLSFLNFQQKLNISIKYFDYYEGWLQDNPDIIKYLGHWKTRISIKNYVNFNVLKDTEFYVEFYAGGTDHTDFAKGGLEIGHIFNYEFWGLNPRFYIQAFNGYGESLLEYNQLEHALRVGILII